MDDYVGINAVQQYVGDGANENNVKMIGAGADTGSFGKTPRAPVVASVLVVLGGLAHVHVIVIGGQAYPMELFPGYEVSSGFGDGSIASYRPRLPDLLSGLGGVVVALFATGPGVKILRILPTSLSDAHVALQR